MLYREAGDFSTTYREDNQTFPIRFDRYRYYAVMLIAFLVIPFFVNDYWVNAIFLPFLIYAIAALGLNILTGYCGQVSLGTGGFMAVGAWSGFLGGESLSVRHMENRKLAQSPESPASALRQVLAMSDRT